MEFDIEIRNGNYDPNILLPLWQEALPELDERRIHWAYEENPQGRACLGLIRVHGEDSPVGCCAVLPRTFFYKGRKISGGITGDFAVRKRWRSLGPAQKLQRTLARAGTFDVLLAFPNLKAEAVQLRSGYSLLAQWVRYRTAIPGPAPRRRFRGPWRWAASSFWDFYWRWKWRELRRRKAPGRLIGKRCEEDLEELWQEGRGAADFLGLRDPGYLQWRFGRHPYRPHDIFFLEKGSAGALAGYIIFFTSDRTTYVQDFFLAHPEDDREKLFGSFLGYCRGRGWEAASVMLAEDRKWARWFPEMGFTAEVAGLKVLIFQREEILSDGAEIFLTPADCDF